jgi:hypothetical protein
MLQKNINRPTAELVTHAEKELFTGSDCLQWVVSSLIVRTVFVRSSLELYRPKQLGCVCLGVISPYTQIGAACQGN